MLIGLGPFSDMTVVVKQGRGRVPLRDLQLHLDIIPLS